MTWLHKNSKHFCRSINSIYYNNGLFIGKKNEIYLFNEETENFNLYYQLPGNVEIFCMHKDRESLWIGTLNAGVFLLKDNNLTHPIPEGNITSIYQDNENELWIGSWEHGLFHVDANGQIENLRHNPKTRTAYHRISYVPAAKTTWVTSG